MPQMGPNQWILMSNMVLMLVIIPTMSNFPQSENTSKSIKKKQSAKNWKW